MPDAPRPLYGAARDAKRMTQLQTLHRTGSRSFTLHCLLAFAESEPLRFARLVREERTQVEDSAKGK